MSFVATSPAAITALVAFEENVPRSKLPRFLYYRFTEHHGHIQFLRFRTDGKFNQLIAVFGIILPNRKFFKRVT